MGATVKIKGPPQSKEVDWFVTNVGPFQARPDARSVVGKGWRFDRLDFTKPYPHKEWTLTVDDDKVLTHYFLTK